MLRLIQIITDERYFMIINFLIVICLYINGYIGFGNVVVDIFVVAFLSYSLTLITTFIALVSLYGVLRKRFNSIILGKYTILQKLEALSTTIELYIDDMNDIKEFELYFECVLSKRG